MATTAHFFAGDTDKLFTTYNGSGSHTGTPSDGSNVEVWQDEQTPSVRNVILTWHSSSGQGPTFKSPGVMAGTSLDFTTSETLRGYTNNSSASILLSDVFTTTTKQFAAAFRLTASATNNANIWDNTFLFADLSQFFGVHFKTISGVHYIYAYNWDGGADVTTGVPISLDTDYVVWVTHEDGILTLRLFGDTGPISEKTVASGATTTMTGQIVIGGGSFAGTVGELYFDNGSITYYGSQIESMISTWLDPLSPTIKTIKPAGGGDYTTLQSWEDWADGETTSAQHAECYDGNLGVIAFAGWSSYITEWSGPRMYAAEGNKHNGTITVQGARIVASNMCVNLTNFRYAEMADIFVDYTDSTSTSVLYVFNSVANSVAELVLDRVVVKRTADTQNSRSFHVASSGFSGGRRPAKLTMRNCVGYSDSGGNPMIYGFNDSNNANNEVHLTVINCTMFPASTQRGLRFEGAGNSINNKITVYNTAIYGSSGSGGINCFLFAGAGTYTGSHNASNDASADDVFPTGALVSRTGTTDFVDYQNSPEIKSTGGLKNSGVDTSLYDVTTDVVGTDRYTPYDIGAWEIPTIIKARVLVFGDSQMLLTA